MKGLRYWTCCGEVSSFEGLSERPASCSKARSSFTWKVSKRGEGSSYKVLMDRESQWRKYSQSSQSLQSVTPVGHFSTRNSLYSLIARYPCMGRHLAKHAGTMHSPDSESALAKVQGNLPVSRLTLAEKRAAAFYIESAD